MMEETGAAEKERIEQQKKDLGEENLKKKGEIVEKAAENNEVRRSFRQYNSLKVCRLCLSQ